MSFENSILLLSIYLKYRRVRLFKLSQEIIVTRFLNEVSSGCIATVYLFDLSHDLLLLCNEIKCHVVVHENAVIE